MSPPTSPHPDTGRDGRPAGASRASSSSTRTASDRPRTMPAVDRRRTSRRGSSGWPVVLIAGVLVFLVLAAAGQSFGRAEPSSNYRPELVADPIRIGCYPLPDGVSLDFAYVVRRDGDVTTASGERRRLTLHWSLLDLPEVRDQLREAFTRAGFEVIGQDTTPSVLSSTRPEPGGGSISVTARLTELDNLSPDPIVRGVLELDLPVVELSSDDPACANPFVTKRFEQDS